MIHGKSIREKILDFCKDSLQNNIGEFKSILIDHISAVNISKHPMPSAFLYGGEESRETGIQTVVNKENWDWTIIIEVWLKPNSTLTLESALTKIHWALGLNPTMDGLVTNLLRTGASEPYVVDPENEIAGRTISYSVKYRHVCFDMTKN